MAEPFLRHRERGEDREAKQHRLDRRAVAVGRQPPQQRPVANREPLCLLLGLLADRDTGVIDDGLFIAEDAVQR